MTPNPTIDLTQHDFTLAVLTGALRSVESIRKSRADSVYEKDWMKGTYMHILGVVGEIALAKYLGIYHSPTTNEFSGMEPDLRLFGRPIEVRHRTDLGWDLIIRNRDKDDSIYVITRGLPPRIELAGWGVGADLKKPEYRKNHGGYGEAWFVPTKNLRHISELYAACSN